MSANKAPSSTFWVWALLLSVFLLAGLPILGGYLSLERLGNRENRAVGSWRAQGSPPEPPVALVDANAGYVYVRGQDGSLLERDQDCPTADNGCWEIVEEIRKDGAYVDRGVSYRGKRAPPPGPVVESLDLVVRTYAEQVVYMQVALLEDGSVWVWQYTADANWSLLTLVSGPVCGFVLALVSVVGIWVVVGVRALTRRRRRATEQ